MSAPGRPGGENRSAQPDAAPAAAVRRSVLRAAAGLAALAVLGAVFAAWLDPHLMRDLADAVRACF